MAEIYRALINMGYLAAICSKCGERSVPLAFEHGIGVWSTPFDLVKGPDRTQEVVDKFAKIGWLLEYQKATCPGCRTNAAKEKPTTGL